LIQWVQKHKVLNQSVRTAIHSLDYDIGMRWRRIKGGQHIFKATIKQPRNGTIGLNVSMS